MARDYDDRPRGFKFVGGPMHGKKVVLRPGERHYRVPVYERHPYVADYGDPFSPPSYRVETYERRPVGFGAWAHIEVMAPEGMGEPEFMRRIADLVEA